MQTIGLARIAQLNMSIKSLEHCNAFYEASEESTKSELAASAKKNTRPGQLLNSSRAKMVSLQEKLAARDAVAISIVHDSWAMLGPSSRSQVVNCRAELTKSVSEAFLVGFIYSQFHAHTAIDVIALHYYDSKCIGKWSRFYQVRRCCWSSGWPQGYQKWDKVFSFRTHLRNCISFYFVSVSVVLGSQETHCSLCFPILVHRLSVVHLF